MKADWKYPSRTTSGTCISSAASAATTASTSRRTARSFRKDCNICHAILAQEEGSSNPVTLQGPNFKHPVDLGDLTAVTCTDCHTGGVGP